MSTMNSLAEMFRGAANLRESADLIDEQIKHILEPLFDLQGDLTYQVMRESEFEGISKTSSYDWSNPVYKLTNSYNRREYIFEDGTFSAWYQYNDGESAGHVDLLPAFLDESSTDDDKKEIIRKIFRDYQQAKVNAAEAEKNRKLEAARKLLAEAGE